MAAFPPLKAVRYFEAAARHLSFSKAAEELNVTHSAISHQIKALEEWVGQPLFDRTGRALRLTEGGRQFLPPVRSAFQQLSDAAQDLRQLCHGGPLTVSVLPSLASKWLVPRLFDFRAHHPEIEVRISATERVEQIGQGGIDIAIRYGRGKWPNVDSELLLKDDLFPIASPLLLSGDTPLKEPRDLANFNLLSDTTWQAAQFDFWQQWLEHAGVTGLELKGGGFSFNYSNLLIQAAVDGLGVALGNTMLASDDLRAGRLVKPFDISVPLDTGYYVVYVRDALKRPKIRAFRDWVMDQVAPFRAEMSPEQEKRGEALGKKLGSKLDGAPV
ncbi:transcriptional regulator GcvA [Dongia sedimenti]|uniref:Transcriptional regulator GcvA n=1 Tax=Dongia sedimenti TaxID=3064282 RepID=A0ABU0YQ88_9PROT|nr:transcriptional regulator GcvA [Rhodospirillaceae bacterium R-7]